MTFADVRHRTGEHCKAHEWSTYPSLLYERWLPDWYRATRQHHAAGSFKPRTEVLWISPRAAKLPGLA